MIEKELQNGRQHAVTMQACSRMWVDYTPSTYQVLAIRIIYTPLRTIINMCYFYYSLGFSMNKNKNIDS